MKLIDMIIDNWRAAFKDPKSTDIQSLKWIIRHNVVTTTSMQGIDSAYKMSGVKTGMASFKLTASDAKELAAFQQIAGTVHGQGIIKMLTDHHNELGDLQIVAFHVFSKAHGNTVYDIVAELGHL